jgi:hypothetical protein
MDIVQEFIAGERPHPRFWWSSKFGEELFLIYNLAWRYIFNKQITPTAPKEKQPSSLFHGNARLCRVIVNSKANS